MDNVYVDISGMSLIDDYDLDYASVDMIVNELINAKETIIYLKERIRELENAPEDIDPATEYGISDRDFI